MKKLSYLIVLTLILGLVLTGCTLLSNIGQVPTNEQSGVAYLTKNGSPLNLVGLWHFDGNADDSSGNSNHGTVYEAFYVGGKFGDVLSFDGVNDWVDIPDLSITGDFSIEFWVNLDTGINNQDAVVGQEGSGQDINFYASKCRWFTAGEGGFPGDAIIANTPSQPNTWEYYAITRSGDTLTLYRNGVADATNEISGINTLPFHPMAIGRGNVGNVGYFGGLIDEVRIWDGALDEDAIRQSYELGGAQSSSPYVVQLSHQVLASGEVVCFTSAFYLDRQVPEIPKIVDIYIMSTSGDRTIEDIGFRRATPARTEGKLVDESKISVTHWTAEVTNGGVTPPKDKTSTSIHLYAELDTDELLGVNAQYLPWD